MTQAVADKKTLVEILLANKDKIRSYGVSDLKLFGSSVRDELHPQSDIDFLIEFFPGEKKYDNFMELSFFLEDLLGREIELVTSNSLSKYIAPYILKEAESVAI